MFVFWDNYEFLYIVGIGSKVGVMVKWNYIFLSGVMNFLIMVFLVGVLCDNYGDDDDVLFDFLCINDVCFNLIFWFVYVCVL